MGKMTLREGIPYLRLIAEVNGLNLSRGKDFLICYQIMKNLV